MQGKRDILSDIHHYFFFLNCSKALVGYSPDHSEKTAAAGHE
jgi:hypothetical protein